MYYRNALITSFGSFDFKIIPKMYLITIKAWETGLKVNLSPRLFHCKNTYYLSPKHIRNQIPTSYSIFIL